MEGVLGGPRLRSVLRPCAFEGSEREQHAALGVHLQVRCRRRRQLPCRRDPALGAGVLRLIDGDRADNDGGHHQPGDHGHQRAEPAVLPGLAVRPLDRVPGAARRRARRTPSRKATSTSVSSGRRGRPPLQCRFEPRAAVELVVGSAERVPPLGGPDQVAEDALAGDVVVEPGLQPGPRPGQRLVGQLERVVARWSPAGPGRAGRPPARARVAQQAPAAHPEADRVAVEGRARPGAAGSTAASSRCSGGRLS